MWELRLIAAFLLVLIQKSVGQSTNILSKKYRQIGVTVVSWNSMEVRATGFLGMGSASSKGIYCGSMCTAHNDCHAYYYDASLCYEAGSSGLLRANPDLSNGRLVYVDSVVAITTTTTTTTTTATTTTSSTTTTTTTTTSTTHTTTPASNFTKVGNNMLLIIDQKLNYADARIKCSDLGSQLVEFQDEYEYDQINNWVSIADFWIGLTDRDIENTWKWESGALLTPDVDAKWSTSQSQPNGDGDCVASNWNSGLRDKLCTEIGKSVCQKRLMSNTPSTTITASPTSTSTATMTIISTSTNMSVAIATATATTTISTTSLTTTTTTTTTTATTTTTSTTTNTTPTTTTTTTSTTTTTTKPPCMTTDGKLCIFPFKYKKDVFSSTKTHNKCTKDGVFTSYPWCATKLKSDGKMDTYGRCRTDGTCEGV